MKKFKLLIILSTLSFILIPASLEAQENLSKEVARLDSSEGSLMLKAADDSSFKLATIGQVFNAKDSIKTGNNSRASILFKTGTILRLASNSALTFLEDNSGKVDLKLSEGKAHFFDREPKVFPQIYTPDVTTAVRGTQFVISVNQNSTDVSVLDGIVECKNNFGQIQANAGERLLTEKGKAPVKSILVKPEDAVQWTLYYPNLFEAKDLAQSQAADLLLKAQSNLSSGQMDEAKANLAEARYSIDRMEQSSDKSKLLSINDSQEALIMTITNNKEAALEKSKKAWSTTPSVPAAISVAYAYQASFELELAKDWLLKAHEMDENNTFVLAKLAELALGENNLDEAFAYSEKAVNLSPSNAYALSVLGFTKLLKLEAREAKSLFMRALESESNFALAKLGLGLALIKIGELELGRQELEKAVALEPTNAVYRSYLGKAYFEEEREDLAQAEYENAIKLDPKDPTAYLYRAYNSLSKNAPVSALKDIEKSIELNNNRAVYRSSLLLDQDLGTRSASLSQAFTQLGFDEAARVEAIKSIGLNYANYSAHQLLAESYSTLQLSDARLSQTKITNLLSPLSFNIIEQSSNVSGLNEYNSLFDREQNQFEFTTDYESSGDIISPGFAFSALEEKYAYLLSYQGLDSNLDSSNSFDRRNIAEAALKYQPNYQNTIMLNASTLFRRFEDDAQQLNKVDFDNYDLDLGFRHSPSANSHLIYEVSLASKDAKYSFPLSEQEIELNQIFEEQLFESSNVLLVDEHSYETNRFIRNSAQWIADFENFSTIIGAQLFNENSDRSEKSPVIDDQEDIFSGFDYALESNGFNQLFSQDLYSYNTVRISNMLELSAGLTYTDLEIENTEITAFTDSTYNKSHLSPKLGVTLYPSSDLTFRAAYFEGLRKSSLEDRASLEPTLVGGLNQVFNDLSGTFSRSYGASADYKVASQTYLGLGGYKRHLAEDAYGSVHEVTLNYDDATALNQSFVTDYQEFHSEQYDIKAYLSQILTERLVANVHQDFFNSRQTDPDIETETEIGKTSLSLRYFDPNRWFVGTKVSYRQQDFEDLEDDSTEDFWLTDLSLGYRLPKQDGIIALTFANIFDETFEYDQSFGVEEFVPQGFNFKLSLTLRN
jgi:Flp pilus assembly protein TadD